MTKFFVYFALRIVKENALTQIKICLGSSCFSRGNKNMVKTIKEYLQQHDLEGKVDFRGGHCFGTCHLGPVVEFDGVIYEKMTEQKLLQLLDEKLNQS